MSGALRTSSILKPSGTFGNGSWACVASAINNANRPATANRIMGVWGGVRKVGAQTLAWWEAERILHTHDHNTPSTKKPACPHRDRPCFFAGPWYKPSAISMASEASRMKRVLLMAAVALTLPGAAMAQDTVTLKLPPAAKG